jgi:hypothetical protein
MSTTAVAAVLMMLYAGTEPPLPVLAYQSAVELPSWLGGARWPGLSPPSNSIMPGHRSCLPGFEAQGSKCLPDCSQGPCRRVRLVQAGEQTTFRDAQGRTTGTATPDGLGGFTYRDAQGRTQGRSSIDGSGTRHFYSPDGRSLGTSTEPRPPSPSSSERRF